MQTIKSPLIVTKQTYLIPNVTNTRWACDIRQMDSCLNFCMCIYA